MLQAMLMGHQMLCQWKGPGPGPALILDVSFLLFLSPVNYWQHGNLSKYVWGGEVSAFDSLRFLDGF